MKVFRIEVFLKIFRDLLMYLNVVCWMFQALKLEIEANKNLKNRRVLTMNYTRCSF
ncbi:MAG: hypothetical protein ACPGTO_05085 [Polaribacter sp.]